MSDKQVRAQYTREFKLEAVRQVRAGRAIAVVAKVLGIPKASLGNWVLGIPIHRDRSFRSIVTADSGPS